MRTKIKDNIIFLALFEGVICGIFGALFAKVISFVTDLRTNNNWIIFGLVFAGLLSVFIFKLCKTENEGTADVIKSVKNAKFVSYLLMPAVFLGAALTHLCGGSAGREGAALQMGGGTAAFLSRFLKLNEEKQRVLTVCGMAGFFSALFGTPLGAAVFVIEAVRIGKKSLSFALPAFLSSLIAYGLAILFRVKPERFPVENVAKSDILRVILIAVLVSFLSIAFCNVLKFAKLLFRKCFKNTYIRIAVGGGIIILLTFLVGNNDYNGGGINIIEEIFSHNSVKYEAFLLKILFTAITVASGFKGGEIIPTFFIGATFGASAASILGIGLPLGAAVGMTAMFCGVTKCPVATLVLALEMFGLKGFAIYFIASAVAYSLSGKCNLYDIETMCFKGDNMFFKSKPTYDWLIVGLGNHGMQYEKTRHNVGFMAADLFAQEQGFSFNKNKMDALLGECKIKDLRILVIKPQTYMNNSGTAVSKVAAFYKIPSDRIIVMHDDISLSVGKLRMRRKGSDGGQRGMRDIIELLGTDNIARIKIGVGSKPHPDYDLKDWVLSKFGNDENENLKKALDNTVSALKEIMVRGIDSAMNKFNS